MRVLALVALLVIGSGCAANMPPNLSPQAAAAWRGTRVIRALDVIRDLAIAAHAETPPLLNEATTRQVVLVHKSLITIVHEQPAGWPGMILAGLDGLESLLPMRDLLQIRPYIHIARAALQEF